MSASNERKLGAGAQLLTVTDFLSEVELLRKEGNRRLLVLSTENLGPGSVTMRVQTPGGNAWFDLPVAAVTGVSPVISGYNNDPSLMMAEVAMRPEFEALFSNIASMAKIPIGAWGYSGAHVVPRNYYERHSIRSARVLQPEPCPITSDDFLGEPGSFTNVGVAPPPRSSYVRVAFFNQEIGSHRALLRQGGRVVARFYGDLSDERLKSAFTSDGNDVQFEFQRCDEFDDGSHRWVPLTNFVTEKASGPDYRLSLSTDNASTSVMVEWGPSIVAPSPPVSPPAPAPAPAPAYLWARGRIQCGGFGFQVATSYAFAWVTSTNSADGPRVPVPRLAVELRIPCRGFSTTKAANGTSDVVASEQFRGAGVDVCCDTSVHAEATLADGRVLKQFVFVKEP